VGSKSKSLPFLDVQPFFAIFAAFLGALCGQKLFTAKSAKKSRKDRKENLF
jgi:hypothetical protein